MAVILLGVRTILGEIVPAFAGIAERVILGAVPALDCPISFPYAPNAVLVGFRQRGRRLWSGSASCGPGSVLPSSSR
ncbi:MAG: hypothetical protein M5T61_21775 [Acidimicrobiia bacterium]|nr:hypothetical protein [Acidimicrobiia bacterium]